MGFVFDLGSSHPIFLEFMPIYACGWEKTRENEKSSMSPQDFERKTDKMTMPLTFYAPMQGDSESLFQPHLFCIFRYETDSPDDHRHLTDLILIRWMRGTKCSSKSEKKYIMPIRHWKKAREKYGSFQYENT